MLVGIPAFSMTVLWRYTMADDTEGMNRVRGVELNMRCTSDLHCA